MGDMSALIDYYLEYKDCYTQLEEYISSIPLKIEYGFGGKMIHRGFYCPSPIVDVVIGNVSRGRLVRRPADPSGSDFVFYRDGDDNLRLVEAFTDSFSGSSKELFSKEFLIVENDLVVAPIYAILKRLDRAELESISVCKYHPDGKILSYAFLLRTDYRSDGTSSDDYELRFESYQYDSQGLLQAALVTLNNGDFYRESSYHFKHSQDGKLTSFQTSGWGKSGKARTEWPTKTYQIPKSRQRRV